MKILHIISQHPESTGSGFYLQNVIRQAAAAGHRNLLVAGISGGRTPSLEGITPESCRYVSFPDGDLDFAIPGMSDVMPYASSCFSDLLEKQVDAYERAFAAKISAAVQDFSPDVIHTHHLWLVTALARRIISGIPMVTSCHSTELRQFSRCAHLRERVLEPCRHIDRILALSGDQAEKIREMFGIQKGRIDIVGGGYNEELFTMRDKEPPPPVRLLYAGKLSFAKGVDWLLRTCAGLAEWGIHLHLAGSGAGEEALVCRELAEDSGDGVTLHGEINQRELAALMQRCHVFILPSFYEGLPLVLLEALASGCRIITTGLPGCRELLGEASDDLVECIDLPVMESIDRPDPRDWSLLEARLAEAIIRMVGRVRKAPTPNPVEIAGITGESRWRAVFRRIEDSYRRARGRLKN
jgi:glycosyltransferase involved in cell wall biosynthesis